MSRDQVIDLRYLTSVTRTNTRLRGLVALGLLRRLETPFFGQSLYCVGAKAREVVGEAVEPLLGGRNPSPRFIQHALAVTNVRVGLIKRGATGWRFEQQLWRTFEYGGRRIEVRPDGLSFTPSGILAVEVDLGHVSPAKFASKLRAYDAFLASGACERLWKCGNFSLLTVTTGKQRLRSLEKLTPRECVYEHVCRSFDDLEITAPGTWS